MKKRQSSKRLTLTTETLRRLSDQELEEVDGAAPTKGAACTFSEPSQCATCLCTR